MLKVENTTVLVSIPRQMNAGNSHSGRLSSAIPINTKNKATNTAPRVVAALGPHLSMIYPETGLTAKAEILPAKNTLLSFNVRESQSFFASSSSLQSSSKYPSRFRICSRLAQPNTRPATNTTCSMAAMKYTHRLHRGRISYSWEGQ